MGFDLLSNSIFMVRIILSVITFDLLIKLLQIILGEVVSRKAEVDQKLAQDLVQIGRDLPFNVVAGKTVCTNDFYEGE